IRVRLAGEVRRGRFRLLDRVLHGFEPNASRRERMRMIRAVAGRDDQRVRRAAPLVDDDAVVARQPAGQRKLDVGLDADADDREVANEADTAGGLDGVDAVAAGEPGDDRAALDLDARVAVIALVELADLRTDDQ